MWYSSKSSRETCFTLNSYQAKFQIEWNMTCIEIKFPSRYPSSLDNDKGMSGHGGWMALESDEITFFFLGGGEWFLLVLKTC